MRAVVRCVLAVIGIAAIMVARPAGVSLTVATQSYGSAIASVLPTRGEVVGVAQPVVVTLSAPVANRHAAERAVEGTRWRDGQMVLRWTAAGMLNAERPFRRIKGHKQMPQLVEALRRHAPPTPSPTPTPNLSEPPPRVHHGSLPKFHATRDMLTFSSRRVKTG